MRLYKKIIAYTNCATTSLGGGNHRYLGLAKHPTQYALISGFPFVRPDHPAPLVFNGGTAAQLAAQESIHKEAVRLHNECESIERILKQQIVNVIEKQFLQAIINSTTRDIQLHLHEIFEYLYRTYGHVTPQVLQDRESEVKGMTYNPLDPIDNIFNEIENLTDLATHEAVPLSQAQCINMAQVIIQKTRKFSNALQAWKRVRVKT